MFQPCTSTCYPQTRSSSMMPKFIAPLGLDYLKEPHAFHTEIGAPQKTNTIVLLMQSNTTSRQTKLGQYRCVSSDKFVVVLLS